LIGRTAAAQRFAAEGIVQIRDVLTTAAAAAVHQILARETPWGLAWQAADDGPHGIRAEELAQLPSAEKQTIAHKVNSALQGHDYGFAYAQYRMLDAYLEKWSEGGPHDLLLEYINSELFMDLVREVTGIRELIKADAQATLYAPNQFLAEHDDSHVGEGWRVAYVLNFCAEDWRPDWGGYLMFYDQEGDVVAGLKPRFNVLNLFRVPHRHNVTYVPPFGPIGRYAITGWFRDR
jgi:Rps23 Pro-64 3,4-dihydroxylase Tpa1-like proline 4-hydroxylase